MRWRAVGGLALLGMVCAACDDYPVLAPRSAEAREIAGYWWLLLVVTGVPALGTILALLLGTLWPRPRASAETSPARQRAIILVLGGVVPLGIVTFLLIKSVGIGSQVTRVEAAPSLTIDVIGRQFWWEVRYPGLDIVTANEVHLPAGRQVRLRLTSGDVIHSFWVPQLGGKMDMVPGQVNEMWLRAEQPGVYRGHCAEFCGVQHALMLFELVAHEPARFETWVQRNQAAASEPVDALARRGLQVFHGAECGHCHTLRGVTPEVSTGVMGPDLTHFASRRMLGAGIRVNNRGNLGGWLLSPQSLKPGNHMPASTMAAEDFHALLHFLEALR